MPTNVSAVAASVATTSDDNAEVAAAGADAAVGQMSAAVLAAARAVAQ